MTEFSARVPVEQGILVSALMATGTLRTEATQDVAAELMRLPDKTRDSTRTRTRKETTSVTAETTLIETSRRIINPIHVATRGAMFGTSIIHEP